MPGHELEGLERAGARDPDRGMRLLDRAGPGVDVAELVVLADELERPGLGPRLDDQVVRLGEALAGLGRVDRERVVLGPAADDHAGDEAAAR